MKKILSIIFICNFLFANELIDNDIPKNNNKQIQFSLLQEKINNLENNYLNIQNGIINSLIPIKNQIKAIERNQNLLTIYINKLQDNMKILQNKILTNKLLSLKNKQKTDLLLENIALNTKRIKRLENNQNIEISNLKKQIISMNNYFSNKLNTLNYEIKNIQYSIIEIEKKLNFLAKKISFLEKYKNGKNK